ncbi:hypothetical protein Tco_0834513 [Tanacetum coccineum]
MKNGSNRYERPITELVEVICVHQPISFVLIFIDNSLRIVVCSVWNSIGDVRPECLWLGDIELLLVAFDSQLKVFHSLKNDDMFGLYNDGTMSLIPKISYLAIFVFVVEVVYFLLELSPLRYSRSLLMK